MHPQARHHVGVELHPKLRRGARLVHGADQHVRYHDVALHVHKAPPRLGFQARNQRNRLAHQRVAAHAQQHQAFDVAPRQQVHGLLADAQRYFQHFLVELSFGRIRLQIGQQRAHLQAQAFAQVAGAHAHRLQAVQQP